MTERLYYSDSRLTEFEARVVATTNTNDGRRAIRLDRTAFYPTGGGQPFDTGVIGQSRVTDCVEEDDDVLHVVEGDVPPVDVVVACRIDVHRRRDHIQQHTGQHILSQAFVELFGAPTKGFRMMTETSEIDVELDSPSDERIEKAVTLSNEIIWDDRPLKIRNVSPEEAATLTLRKESAREGDLRIIEIEGFDRTPCGGTHAGRTGEVGLIAVRQWERAKGLTRITFVAGGRALEDYRRANRTARDVAAQFSVAREEAASSVARLFEEHKELLRRSRVLAEIAARSEAKELHESATRESANEKSETVVAQIFDGRTADELKQLALALIQYDNTVALLGSRDKDAARIIFARSQDLTHDVNALVREACTTLEGRGGGRPDLAQGGGKLPEKLDEVIATARKKVLARA